jgi:hypothetical protein
VFSTTRTFDQHRVGPYTDRRCLTTDELLAKDWSNKKGFWRGPSREGNPWFAAKANQPISSGTP